MIDFRQQPKGYEQGIYDIPFGLYSAIPALNSSKLKLLKKSPLHFKTAVESPPKVISAIQRRTFDKGKLFDKSILDGFDPLDLVAIEPDLPRNSKGYKEWLEMVPPDKLILPQSDVDDVAGMVEKAWEKERFSELFSAGSPHRVIVWQCPETGLWLKAEIDWITDDGIVVDLKTTEDAGFWFFSRNARRLRYYNQGALYLYGLTCVTGVHHDEFLLAAHEKNAPYESRVFRPLKSSIYEAMDENLESLRVVRECLDTDEWRGYLDEIICLDTGQYEENMDDDEEFMDDEIQF